VAATTFLCEKPRQLQSRWNLSGDHDDARLTTMTESDAFNYSDLSHAGNSQFGT